MAFRPDQAVPYVLPLLVDCEHIILFGGRGYIKGLVSFSEVARERLRAVNGWAHWTPISGKIVEVNMEAEKANYNQRGPLREWVSRNYRALGHIWGSQESDGDVVEGGPRGMAQGRVSQAQGLADPGQFIFPDSEWSDGDCLI